MLGFRKQQLHILCILLLTLILSACGGAGGGGGSVDTSSNKDGSGIGGGSSYGAATLSWLPPTENTDGSALTNLAGYNIYYGTEAGNYTEVITISNPGIAEYLVENLPSGNTYYFVITAFDADGNESEYSPTGSKTIPA